MNKGMDLIASSISRYRPLRKINQKKKQQHSF